MYLCIHIYRSLLYVLVHVLITVNCGGRKYSVSRLCSRVLLKYMRYRHTPHNRPNYHYHCLNTHQTTNPRPPYTTTPNQLKRHHNHPNATSRHRRAPAPARFAVNTRTSERRSVRRSVRSALVEIRIKICNWNSRVVIPQASCSNRPRTTDLKTVHLLYLVIDSSSIDSKEVVIEKSVAPILSLAIAAATVSSFLF
ncbi:hypothetical protein DFP73DRAFT_523238 [Morchella snyderi]|nr:hypothetical protein DFP73DRAFT_523238 [Morchella snyderi]